MNLLLDTNVLLWSLLDSPRLSAKARKAIVDAPFVYVSAASAWEIAIKRALGKLVCPDDLEGALRATQFSPLAVTVPHALAAGALPRHHDDPFDRMLIAQAKAESLTQMTGDARLSDYGARVMVV